MPSTSTDRIDGLTTSVAVKAPCIIQTTGAITLSGTQTVNGHACVVGERVLVMNQADNRTNGIYVVSKSAWTRALDFDGSRDAVTGTLVIVGAVGGANACYQLTTTDNPIIFGTSAITFGISSFSSATLPTLNFTQAGAGAVTLTAQNKMRQWIHIRDFGAICDGVTDDTTAINNAIASATNGTTVVYDGKPLISSTITINKKIEFYGLGGIGLTNTDLPSSYLLKKSTMTTAGITTTATGVILRGGGCVASVGSTGDLIVINGNHNQCYSVSAIGNNAGGDNGIRVGSNGAGVQCDAWLLSGCRAAYVGGGIGVYVHSVDGMATGGVAIDTVCNNQAVGFQINNAAGTVLTACAGVLNSAYGMVIDVLSTKTFVNGGTWVGNATQGIILEPNSAGTQLIGVDPTLVTDSSVAGVTNSTVRAERLVTSGGTWTPAFAGAGTPGTQTYAAGGQVGFWTRVGDEVTVFGSLTMTNKDGATAGNLRITGLPFSVPAGFTSLIVGLNLAGIGGFSMDAGYTQISGGIQAGNNYIDLTEQGSAQPLSFLGSSLMSTAGRLYFHVKYPINKIF